MKKLLLLLLLIPNLVMGESHTCNCSEIDCIEAKDILIDNSKVTKSIKGILASKYAIHPSRGKFSSPILIFNEAKCIYGNFYLFGDGPNARFEQGNNITHIQLSLVSLDKKEMEFYKKNKGNEVLVTGHFFRSFTAWHTTHPFFFIVEEIGEAE